VEEWHLDEAKLKKYPHFDPPISAEKAEKYATDKVCVARHAFYPFILFRQRWTRFAKKGKKGVPKERPIRYAARRDAYIFSYYRHVLSQCYEAELAHLGLGASVLAYRRIQTSDGKGGKCNIHFARDAFLKIRELGDCFVIALDISSYFESLDHQILKAVWCTMLGVSRLPSDHFRVFEAITKYAVADKKSVYERLGHFGDKAAMGGKSVKGYLTPFRGVPKHLCRGREFRRLISGSGGQKSIIEKNYKPYGIPQGAPISDLLANLYLLDFDSIIAGWVGEVGGSYFRYSDDILIVAPGTKALAEDLMTRTQGLIHQYGDKLRIKDEKSSLLIFQRRGADQEFQLLQGEKGKDGLEYLGFRYDGKRVFLRNATISNLLRKIAGAAYRDADSCARRYPDKDVPELKLLFNYERLIKQFGRAEDFGESQKDYRNWTFWTYASRASKAFGTLGKPILRQLKRHRELIREHADRALERAVVRREMRMASRIAARKASETGALQES